MKCSSVFVCWHVNGPNFQNSPFWWCGWHFIYKNYYLFQLLRSIFALSYCCPYYHYPDTCSSYSFSYWYSYSYSSSSSPWCDFLTRLHLQLGSIVSSLHRPRRPDGWVPTPHVDRQHLPTHLAAIGPSPSIQLRCFKRLGAWYDATPPKKAGEKNLTKSEFMCRQKGCNFYSIYISPFARTWSFHFIYRCRCFCVCFSWKNIIHGPLFFYHKNTSHHLCGQKDGIILWDENLVTFHSWRDALNLMVY